MEYREIREEDNAALADIIRGNLKAHGLDIPGTVYFDDNLNHLSEFYLAEREKRFYYILTDTEGNAAGGVGLAEFPFFENCAELQKLYLRDDMKGQKLGYQMIRMAEEKARELGYEKLYLETHDHLQAAIHEYENCGFQEIEKPAGVVHGAMNRFFLKNL